MLLFFGKPSLFQRLTDIACVKHIVIDQEHSQNLINDSYSLVYILF